MVQLTQAEKRELCLNLASCLPKLRELINVTQREFGELCGISTPRISVIENGHFIMTWSQFTSMLAVLMCNLNTKEYLFANGILTTKLLQYIQLKDDNIPPTVNVSISEKIVKMFIENEDNDSNR